MYTVGVICRHFDVDAVIERYASEESSKRICKTFAPTRNGGTIGADEKPMPLGLRHQILNILAHFCAVNNEHLQHMALCSLGQLTAECPEFLREAAIKRVMIESLKRRHIDIQIQALTNLSIFLIAADERAIKYSEQYREQREQREGDLKGERFARSTLQIAPTHTLVAFCRDGAR